MKTFSLITFIILFFICCNSIAPDDTPTLEAYPSDPHKELIEEYNIDIPELVIEYVIAATDTTKLYITGWIKNKLWIGCYDIKTKEELVNWTKKIRLRYYF